jgi:T5SS/PEP-CTERM-associated repeat protein/autotransporter-associated beta strand protein
MKKDGVVQRSREDGARLLPLAAALIAVFATVYGSRAAQAQSVEASGDVSPGIPAPPLSQWIVGSYTGGQSTTTVSGSGLTWTNSGNLTVGGFGSGILTVAEVGRVSVQAGAGTVSLATSGSASGTIHIGAASPNSTAATAAGTLDAAKITFGAGAGTLNFNHIDSHYDFGAALSSTGSGTHKLNQYAGVTRLTVDSSTLRGATTVSGGALIVADKLGGTASVTGGRFQVDGNVAGQVTVEQTGTLTGAGAIDGDATFSAGGVLAGTQGQTLTIRGHLALDSASQVNVALGGAFTPALFDVGGDLQLDGTLNVSDQGGFGAGVYRLFNYGGTLSGNGLTLGAAPGAVSLNGGTLATTSSFETTHAVTLAQRGGIAVSDRTTLGLSGAISGEGELVKRGAGQLNVTGDGSAFTGHTQVQSGTLSVGIRGQGRLGGTLTVYNSATLQSTGTDGTLTFEGDLNFAPDSFYFFEADPNSDNSDRIVVTGTANLAGTMALVEAEGGFVNTRQYTILTANVV